jgi:hypothetical protein
MTFAGTGLASNLNVTARAFDKTTRAKLGADVVLTWNAGTSRYEGDMDFDYDYGNVTLLVFGTNPSNQQQVARAIVDYDVTTGGSTIPFNAAAKYELRDIGPGGGYVAVDNSSYASDGLGGFWRYVEMAPVESATTLKWLNDWTQVTGTSDKTVGSGKNNTHTIVTLQTNQAPAAWYCDGLDYNECTDWFLPSYDELVAASSLSGSSIFLHSSFSYWSSSERTLEEGTQDAAWYYNALVNGAAKKNKNDVYVKAARYF